MSLRSLLESTAMLKRPATSRDANRGSVLTYNEVWAANKPCSCQQASVSVQTMYAQRDYHVSTTIFFDEDPGANVNDILVVTGNLGETTTYQVQGTNFQGGNRYRLWSVDCTQVNQP